MAASSVDQSVRTRADRRWLDERREEFERQRAVWARRETRWSWARLMAFLAAVAPWFFLGQVPFWAGTASLLALALFVIAIVVHLACLAERDATERLLLVTGEALQRCGGAVRCLRGWERPADEPALDGLLPRLFEARQTWPLSVQERDDLDLFAPPVGIFGLLNRTSTACGARRLRDQLENLLLDADQIRARQRMVGWLAEHGGERLRLMAALAALRTEDARTSKLLHAIADRRPPAFRWPYGSVVAWSALSVGAVAFALTRAELNSLGQVACVAGVLLVNAAIVGSLKLRRRLDAWQDVGWAARGCLTVARQAALDLPAEGDLSLLRECFRCLARPQALPRLRRRAAWSESAGLVHFLLNGLLLFDIHILRAIERCACVNRDDLLRGLSAVAELDVLCSLGAWTAEQPLTCFPVPADGTVLTILDGVHPLVAPERVVPNDVHLSSGQRLWVITGSNMAGKSTFLRMAGVNVLLGQIGAATAARYMQWSPVRLLTDLRARDDLAQDESYFLAEVRHVRRMVSPPGGPGPILGLLDEPFRGTNSQQQSAASVAVLRYLSKSPNLFLVATHDAHLTAVADATLVRNWHFGENLSPDAIVFDYRLRPGPARTRNALRILEREGYPPELVARAYRWLDERGP